LDSSITHLHTALQQISSWISANRHCLTVNFFKTGFLIILFKSNFLKQAALHSPLILHATLVLFLMNILPCPIRSHRSHHFVSRAILISAVTILKSKSKIAIFCQNRSKSKLSSLLSHCYDFLQQLMDVTGLNDLTMFVVIVVLSTLAEVVGLQHSTQ